MTIQIPNPGSGNGASGDNEFVLWSKVKDNFNDQTNAASRLVGGELGNLIPVGFQNIGSKVDGYNVNASERVLLNSLLASNNVPHLSSVSFTNDGALGYPTGTFFRTQGSSGFTIAYGTYTTNNANLYPRILLHQGIGTGTASTITGDLLIRGVNAHPDSNGFFKTSSPVVDLYNDRVELNQDAEKQPIAFEKVSVGNYLVKGSLGFAQEGWYIETPKDANGNVLVAVVYEQLANNDLSIKTYAKRFDDETGDIVPNLARPRDIPTGRFVSLRLHELPKEPPVIPDDIQTEQLV